MVKKPRTKPRTVFAPSNYTMLILNFDVLHWFESDSKLIETACDEAQSIIRKELEDNIDLQINFKVECIPQPITYESPSELYQWGVNNDNLKYPVILIDSYASSGLAGTGSIKNNKSVTVVGLCSSKKDPYNSFLYVLLHEIGHTFGANHDANTNTIMDSTGGSKELIYSEYSKNQMEEVLAQIK